MHVLVIAGFALVIGLALGLTLARRRARPPVVPAAEAASSWPEAAHQPGDQMLRLIADSVPEAVLFFSDLGLIRYANAAARELFFEGNAPDGQNFIRLVGNAPVPLREALLGDSDRLFSMELGGRRETYHLSRRTFTLEGELHTLLVVMHMTREISRHEVEVLKRVVRVISHEVNNSLAPVTSLIHSARLIAKNPEHSAKLERVFDTVDERTRHLKTFLDGYATLARLPKPRARAVELSTFLRQLTSLYPNVGWPTPPAQEGFFDSAQIEQVLINLVKNALEAGSAEAEIEVRLTTREDGTCELDVLDRGPGFSAEALKNALMPLYTTKASGSGMGLSLSQEITEAHGGSIGVTNRSDGGAWIRVILPGRSNPSGADLTRSRLTLTRA
jgi:nitrogen fixation/metabolism regulation signal transduction histidine kinase